MTQRTVQLPFARTLTLARPYPGTGAREALVIESLPVTLSVHEDDGPVARETHEGATIGRRHLVDGRPYGGYVDDIGLTPEDAARRIGRLIADGAHRHPSRRVHEVAALAGLAVVDDGREAQEAGRAACEADAVIVNGRLLCRAALPRLEIRVTEDGRVRLDLPLSYPDGMTSMSPYGPAHAWMTFDIGSLARAREMAEAVALMTPDLDPALDWRDRHPKGVDGLMARHWTLAAPDVLSEVSLADGGPGTPEERAAAMARDFVALLAPQLGRHRNDVVRGFADLRDALDHGEDPAPVLAAVAAAVIAAAPPAGLTGRQWREALDLRVAAACLELRLSRFEPEPASAPAPR